MGYLLAVSLTVILSFSGCNKTAGVGSSLPDNCAMMADTESPSKKVCFVNIDGRAIIEGDIDIGSVEELKNPKAKSNDRTALAARKGLRFRWPGAIVPYVIDSTAAPYRGDINGAIAHYHEKTGIRFQVRGSETDFVTFRGVTGNSSCANSLVGRVGNNQAVNIFGVINDPESCPNKVGSIVHELGHAVGLFHEHQRRDRNQLIKIHPLILSGKQGPSLQFNYQQQLYFGEDINGHDLGSIMHYSPLQGDFYDANNVRHLAFIKVGTESLTYAQQSAALSGVGQRLSLSQGDIDGLAYLYSNSYIEQPEIGVTESAPVPTSISFLLADHSSNEDGFIVEKRVSDFYTGVRYVEFARLPAITSSNIENEFSAPILQTVGNLPRGTSYDIRVRAFSNSGRVSSPSTVITVRTLAAPPAAPSNLAGSAVSGALVPTVRLSWSIPSGPVSGYKISKSLNLTGPWDTEVSASVSLFNYSLGLSSDTQYYFRIRAFNEGGDSDYSIPANVRTLPIPPLAPTAFAAAATGSDVNLSWIDYSNNETGFKIERALAAAGPWTAFPSLVGANTISANDLALAQNTKFFYRISAVNAAGASAFVSTSVTTGYALPMSPTGVAVSVATRTSVKVTWVENSALKTGFMIEKAMAAAGPWAAETPNSGATLRSKTVSGLVTTTKYFFRVTTLNGTNRSAPSAVVSITTGVPIAPTSVTAIATSPTAVNLAWMDTNDNETAVDIYMKKGASGTYAKLTPSPAVGVFAYAKTGLLANTKYFFKVRATNLAGYSESTAVSVTTPM